MSADGLGLLESAAVVHDVTIDDGSITVKRRKVPFDTWDVRLNRVCQGWAEEGQCKECKCTHTIWGHHCYTCWAKFVKAEDEEAIMHGR